MEISEAPPIGVDVSGWKIYFRMVDDKVNSVAVHLGIANQAPDAGLPFVTMLRIPFEADENGFPPEAEQTRLDAIEEAFEKLVNPPPSFFQRVLKVGKPLSPLIFVGRVTGAGKRSYYYYANREVEKTYFVKLQEQFAKYVFEAASFRDEKWEVFLSQLHPGNALKSLLLNAALLEIRSKGGDQLIEERDVDHTLSFPDKKSRNKFISCIKDDGWKIKTFEQNDKAESDKSFSFCVNLTKRHRIDQMWSDIVIVALCDRADLYGGKYDGWGAFDVKKKE